jgi:hypothetical protein
VIQADWEKYHYDRPLFLSRIYLERVVDIAAVRERLLPRERNLTEADREQVDATLAVLQAANQRLRDTYYEAPKSESR